MRPEKVDLLDVVDECIESSLPLVRDKRLKLEKDVPLDLPAVDGDRTRIKQVLLNLMSNAIKFTARRPRAGPGPARGRARSTSRWPTPASASPRNDLRRLFEPFQRLDNPLAQQADGTGPRPGHQQEVRRTASRAASGRKAARARARPFTSRCRSARAQPRPKGRSCPHRFSAATARRPRSSTSRTTPRTGCWSGPSSRPRATRSSTPRTGWPASRRRCARSRRSSCSTSTCRRIDGYEVVAILKSFPAFANTPVVALTAYAMEGDRQRTLVAGCDGYIQKPIDVDAFPRQVEEFLHGKREQVEEREQSVVPARAEPAARVPAGQPGRGAQAAQPALRAPRHPARRSAPRRAGHHLRARRAARCSSSSCPALAARSAPRSLVGRARRRRRARRRWPARPPSGRAACWPAPALAPADDWTEVDWTLPLTVRGRALGAMTARHVLPPGAKADEEQLLNIVANQVGHRGGERAPLRRRRPARGRAAEPRRGRSPAGRHLRLADVLQRFTELVRTRLGLDVVRIWLHEGRLASTACTPRPASPSSPTTGAGKFEPGEGIVGWVMEHLTPLVIADLQVDPRLQEREWATGRGAGVARGRAAPARRRAGRRAGRRRAPAARVRARGGRPRAGAGHLGRRGHPQRPAARGDPAAPAAHRDAGEREPGDRLDARPQPRSCAGPRARWCARSAATSGVAWLLTRRRKHLRAARRLPHPQGRPGHAGGRAWLRWTIRSSPAAAKASSGPIAAADSQKRGLEQHAGSRRLSRTSRCSSSRSTGRTS